MFTIKMENTLILVLGVIMTSGKVEMDLDLMNMLMPGWMNSDFIEELLLLVKCTKSMTIKFLLNVLQLTLEVLIVQHVKEIDTKVMTLVYVLSGNMITILVLTV